MPETIRFYSSPRHGVKFNPKVTPLLEKKDLYKHEFLSNFQHCDKGVEVHGVYGPTSEHVFQALRWLRAPEGETPELTALRREYADEIAMAKTPSGRYTGNVHAVTSAQYCPGTSPTKSNDFAQMASLAVRLTPP